MLREQHEKQKKRHFATYYIKLVAVQKILKTVRKNWLDQLALEELL